MFKTDYSLYQKATVPSYALAQAKTLSEKDYFTVEKTDLKTQETVFLYIFNKESIIQAHAFSTNAGREHYISQQETAPANLQPTSLANCANVLKLAEFTLYDYVDHDARQMIYFVLVKNSNSSIEWNGFQTIDQRIAYLHEIQSQGLREHTPEKK